MNKLKIGCDLVFIPKFVDSAKQSNGTFLEKLFTSYELAQEPTYESLAGVFAVKEAFLKASGLKFDSWHQMEVYKLASGKPVLHFPTDIHYESIDISISHDGDYAMAVVVIMG